MIFRIISHFKTLDTGIFGSKSFLVNSLPHVVKGFIEGFLATIVLEIFFSVLPDVS